MGHQADYMPYILITPSRNEAKFIETTIQSVIKQTVLPSKWVIVNDGSTDETASIVDRYAAKYSWIELINLPARKERNFAAKVHASHGTCLRSGRSGIQFCGPGHFREARAAGAAK